MSVSDPKDSFKNAVNPDQQQTSLENYLDLDTSCRKFKEAGCNAAFLHGILKNTKRSWQAVDASAEQVGNLYWFIKEGGSEIYGLIDLNIPIDQQFPVNQDAPLIPPSFASAIAGYDRKAFYALPSQEQDNALGEVASFNSAGGVAWWLNCEPTSKTNNPAPPTPGG